LLAMGITWKSRFLSLARPSHSQPEERHRHRTPLPSDLPHGAPQAAAHQSRRGSVRLVTRAHVEVRLFPAGGRLCPIRVEESVAVTLDRTPDDLRG
jgi:hypothetical protein